MDFSYDARSEELREQLLSFMDSHVYPAEKVFAVQVAEAAAAGRHWERPPVIDELKAEARSRGLWNLFLAHHPAGAGLTNLQYAPLAEITGHSPGIAPEALNCAAPDTGNMELLAEFGTEEQQQRWLRPLLDGEIRSAFCMTEPDVASSDATNVATRIERNGTEYVINGRKWWTTGILSSDCKLVVVMGLSDPHAVFDQFGNQMRPDRVMLAAFDGNASRAIISGIGADPRKRFSLQSKYKRGTKLERTSVQRAMDSADRCVILAEAISCFSRGFSLGIRNKFRLKRAAISPVTLAARHYLSLASFSASRSTISRVISPFSK